MLTGDDDDIDAILRRIIYARDPSISVLSISVAVAAWAEVQRSPGLARRCALDGLQSRARRIMGVRAESVADAATRLRGRGRKR